MDEMQAIRERHSVRRYLNQPITSEIREQLDAFIEEVNKESGLHIRIQYDDPDGFDSKLAHYGSFRNVKNYIILAGEDQPDFEERCGYYGEKVVLKAQSLGLNTCWAALTFNKKRVRKLISESQRFSMVIALGYGETAGVNHKGKGYQDVTLVKAAPEWFQAGVEAALLAPTATNQQKFKIELQGDTPVIQVSGFGFYTKVDLGIVKYHFEVGAGAKYFFRDRQIDF